MRYKANTLRPLDERHPVAFVPHKKAIELVKREKVPPKVEKLLIALLQRLDGM